MPTFAQIERRVPWPSPVATTNNTAGPGVRHSTSSVSAKRDHRCQVTARRPLPDRDPDPAQAAQNYRVSRIGLALLPMESVQHMVEHGCENERSHNEKHEARV